MRRRLSALGRACVVVAVAVGATASCSPAPKEILAVESDGEGGARLLTMTCPEYTGQSFGVYLDDESDVLRSWSVRRGPGAFDVDAVRVFHAPEGWAGEVSDLTGFTPGGSYFADVDGGVNGRGVSGKVAFGIDRLKDLSEGEVLTSDGDGGTSTMSRDDFLDMANERCADLR
ncbi:hypothetical protein [Streptomyces sp. NPDC003023]|uniref:hypothetical protein n=1 Tax=Streptomyces sp. NPDC003023 TaxID=3364675 RepID=UPI00367BAE52